jgi:hypothetical protein
MKSTLAWNEADPGDVLGWLRPGDEINPNMALFLDKIHTAPAVARL